jgi:hypothetical protein
MIVGIGHAHQTLKQKFRLRRKHKLCLHFCCSDHDCSVFAFVFVSIKIILFWFLFRKIPFLFSYFPVPFMYFHGEVRNFPLYFHP